MHRITKRNLLEMFIDRTAGESTRYNRLTTEEEDDGSVSLIAYGWLKVATYDESRGVVTVFSGHKSIGSTTVSRYLNDVVNVAEDRGRDVILSGESPTVDTPNEGTRFIGNYVGNLSSSKSSVEREAIETVVESLA